MSTHPEVPKDRPAQLVILKPKRLLPPHGEEHRIPAAKRMFAETVHDYFNAHQANHLRSRRDLLKRIDEVNMATTEHPKASAPTQQEFLSAIRKEKYRRARMAAWQASLTPEAVDHAVTLANRTYPGRVVKLRRGLVRTDAVSAPPHAG